MRKKHDTEEVVNLVSDEEIIDLIEPPGQRWGQPGRCPECDGRGYLDQIDMRSRVMHQHCTECMHKWVTAESELTPSSR